MSNIYIQEPLTNGKVLLVTSVGDIDIELWSKEAPKACRNFVQLCLEGYYDGVIFHRVVRSFIVQGGDPTGTGEGGESIYGKTFKDEVHSRLRFARRGLVAMANAGPNDNGSQFFFTMGAAPELNNKHTIFGMVAGNTVYNMLKLEELEVDENERPLFPHRIIKTKVISNPFDDIIPRNVSKVREERPDEARKKKSKSRATKNFSLLSFGEEAEEDEEEVIKATETLRGKAKSTHDVLKESKHSKSSGTSTSEKKTDKGDMKIADIMKESKATEESEEDSDDGIPEEMMGQTLQELRATAEIIRRKLLKEHGDDLTDDTGSGSRRDSKDSVESPRVMDTKSPKHTAERNDSDQSFDSNKSKIIDKGYESNSAKKTQKDIYPEKGESKQSSPNGSECQSVSSSVRILSKEVSPKEKSKVSVLTKSNEQKDFGAKKDKREDSPKRKEQINESPGKNETHVESPRRKDSPHKKGNKAIKMDSVWHDNRIESPLRRKDEKQEAGIQRGLHDKSPKHKDHRPESPKQKHRWDESPKRSERRHESPRGVHSSQTKKGQTKEISPKKKINREQSPKRQKENRCDEKDPSNKVLYSRSDSSRRTNESLPHDDKERMRSKDKSRVSPHRGRESESHTVKDCKGFSDTRYGLARNKERLEDKEPKRSGTTKEYKSPNRSRSRSPHVLKRSHSPKYSKSFSRLLSVSPHETKVIKKISQEEIGESQSPKHYRDSMQITMDKKHNRLEIPKDNQVQKDTPATSEPARKKAKQEEIDISQSSVERSEKTRSRVEKESDDRVKEKRKCKDNVICNERDVERRRVTTEILSDDIDTERRRIKKEMISNKLDGEKRGVKKERDSELETERQTLKRESANAEMEAEKKRVKKEQSEDIDIKKKKVPTATLR